MAHIVTSPDLIFLLRDFSRSFSGYLSRHIFCSCLLQNASDFWMKFFPTGCNFCSFLWVHQFCCINFRWRVVARDTFSLSILAYWMGYALYSILYLAMFRQCNLWKESSCTWSQTYRDQQWINWKPFFFWEKIFDNEEHEHYQYKLLPGQKHTLSFVFVFVFELEFLFFICCDTNCGDSQKSFLLHCCQMI